MKLEEKLKKGFTTGTCAQAAAKAAGIMLATKTLIKSVEVETPKGVKLNLKIVGQKIGRDFAQCGVIKDAGDDPDVTNGAMICARVRYSGKKGVFLRGGEGVGVVTKPGLAVSVGEYAINPVPREMIIKDVTRCLSRLRLNRQDRGIEIIISVPKGKEIARRTFNPRLGIMGGISIIGTTGIVEPKSQDAYKKSLSLQLDVLKAAGYKRAALVPGYVGEKFCRQALGLESDSIIKIGDHIGFMIAECVKKNIKKVLLAGHIGKLVKVANGQFDTNIRFGDNRIKTIMHYAGLCGAKKEIIKKISRQQSAEAAIDILTKHNLTQTFDIMVKKIVSRINEFAGDRLSVGCIMLSLQGKILAVYPNLTNLTRLDLSG
ncbi:MAG: cobalt-precorrin-5B (C(1))-methyltransferase CbiD [Candidatus Omnitrophota bacterium]|nr:cobalt-precorrin-5B (C(1))-methyltransferase CbiD [Candidatus Omnitrophota bacterium]